MNMFCDNKADEALEIIGCLNLAVYNVQELIRKQNFSISKAKSDLIGIRDEINDVLLGEINQNLEFDK